MFSQHKQKLMWNSYHKRAAPTVNMRMGCDLGGLPTDWSSSLGTRLLRRLILGHISSTLAFRAERILSTFSTTSRMDSFAVMFATPESVSMSARSPAIACGKHVFLSFRDRHKQLETNDCGYNYNLPHPTFAGGLCLRQEYTLR